MARSAWLLLGFNVALIVLWFVLRTIWFEGSVGCDDSLPPRPLNCERDGTILTYLAVAEAALLVSTMLWIAPRWVTGRLRRRRMA